MSCETLLHQCWQLLNQNLGRYSQIANDPRFHEFALLEAIGAAHQVETRRGVPAVTPQLTSQGCPILSPRNRWPGARHPNPTYVAQLATLWGRIGHALQRQELLDASAAAQGWMERLAPFPTLFCREGDYSERKPRGQAKRFIDPESALLLREDLALTLCGDGTGLGVIRQGEVEIRAFGPQLGPLGSLASFGIYNPLVGLRKPTHISEDRLTGIVRLSRQGEGEDVAMSGEWLEVDFKVGNSLQMEILPTQLTDEVAHFVFFVKAPSCKIGQVTLEAGSLDRYQGKGEPLTFGQDLVLSGGERLEVIPLGGGKRFWGCDYLVAFPLSSSTGDRLEGLHLQCAGASSSQG